MSDKINLAPPECSVDDQYLEDLLGMEGWYCAQESDTEDGLMIPPRSEHGKQAMEVGVSACLACHDAKPPEYILQYESAEDQAIYNDTGRVTTSAPSCYSCHDYDPEEIPETDDERYKKLSEHKHLTTEILSSKPEITVENPPIKETDPVISYFFQSNSSYLSYYDRVGGRALQTVTAQVNVNPKQTKSLFSIRTTASSSTPLISENNLPDELTDWYDEYSKPKMSLYEAKAGWRTTGPTEFHVDAGLFQNLSPFNLISLVGADAGVSTDAFSTNLYAGVSPFQPDTAVYGGGFSVHQSHDGNSGTVGVDYQKITGSDSIGDFAVQGAGTYVVSDKGGITARASSKIFASPDNSYCPIPKAHTSADLFIRDKASLSLTYDIETKQTDDPSSGLPLQTNQTLGATLSLNPLKSVEVTYSEHKGTWLVHDSLVELTLDLGELDLSAYYQNSEYSLTEQGITVETFGGSAILDIAGTETEVAVGHYSQDEKFLLDEDRSDIWRLKLGGKYILKDVSLFGTKMDIEISSMIITDARLKDPRVSLKISLPIGKNAGSADSRYKEARSFFENEIGKIDRTQGNFFPPCKTPQDMTFDHDKGMADIECASCHDYDETLNLITFPEQEVCFSCHHTDESDDHHISINYNPEDIVCETPPVIKRSHATYIANDIECETCHSGDNKSVDLDILHDSAKTLECFDCHTPAIKHKKPRATTGPQASFNHDPIETWRGDFHHLYRDEEFGTCSTCHDNGANSACDDCHRPAIGGGTRPETHGLFYDFIHGLESQVGSQNCQTCHTPTITSAVELCTGGCHEQTLVSYLGKHPQGMRCDQNETTPQNLHGSFALDLGSKICMQCHTPEHDSGVNSGPAIPCSTCHDVDLGDCE